MTQTAVEAAVSAIDYVIGENVDTLRRRAGLTKAQLATRFQVSPSAMSLKLSGKRAWSALDVQAVARIFGVRMAQVQGEEPLPDPTSPAVITDITPMLSKRERATKLRTTDYKAAVSDLAAHRARKLAS